MTTFSITVRWEALPCIHRNGDVTGYSVQYREVGNGSMDTYNSTGDNITEATISNLKSSTTYTIGVAAVNSEGVGVVSYPLIVDTLPGMERYYFSHIMSIYAFILRSYIKFIIRYCSHHWRSSCYCHCHRCNNCGDCSTGYQVSSDTC